MAERAGFEPAVPILVGTHALQACALIHSATSPPVLSWGRTIRGMISPGSARLNNLSQFPAFCSTFVVLFASAGSEVIRCSFGENHTPGLSDAGGRDRAAIMLSQATVEITCAAHVGPPAAFAP